MTPPVSSDRDELLAKAAPLKGLADAVNITDGAGARPHLGASPPPPCWWRQGIEPILQFTCRDRNRIALQSDLMSAAACGVRNLLMLRGDDPSAGDQPDAKPVFDLDPRQLAGNRAALARQRRTAVRPQGLRRGARSFSAPPTIRSTRRRAGSRKGCRPRSTPARNSSQTQFCMDAGVVRRYMARLAEHGIAGKLHVLIGVAPLRSAKSALWMKEKLFGTIIPDAIVERMEQAGDPLAEGRKICVEVIRELSEIPDVAGVHIMAPNNDAAVPDGHRGGARKSIKRLAAGFSL